MRALILLVCVALGLVLVAFASGRQGGEAAFPGANGQIAFYDVAPGNIRHIYMRTPGSASRTQLTFGDDFDQNPEYSADGQMIVFDRVRNDVRSIWTMNSDGSNQQEVPNTETGRGAAWSPDGEWILFSIGKVLDIYKVRPDGSDLTQLTDDPNISDLSPEWSPDGTTITFERENEIWVMNADASGQKPLTNKSDVNAGGPDWSPDGSKIVFTALLGSEVDIYVMNSDGTDVTNLTEDAEGEQGSARFSPDGEKIVYVQDTVQRRGRIGSAGSPLSELYIMNADGSGKTNLTQDPLVIEDAPTWGSFGAGQTITWGDNRCEGDLDTTDGLAILRHVAALSELSQTPPCPTVEQEITALQPGLWGDVDCDDDVDTVDDLKVLRVVAGFKVEQPKDCYAIGFENALIQY